MLNFGGFLSSNFWSNYRCQSSASIEDLLNSKECSVDKISDCRVIEILSNHTLCAHEH